VDGGLACEAQRLLTRYLIEVVERYGLCPWAAPARARGDMRIDVVDVDDAATAIDRFLADENASVGLIVLPGFTGEAAELRGLRDVLLVARGHSVAIADFHPRVAVDLRDAHRLVPFLRRSPDPMLQVVRHTTLSTFRRPSHMWLANEQAAMMAGKEVTRPPDPIGDVATANFATVCEHRQAIEEALDDIMRDRAQSYDRFYSTRLIT
jgi:hypothetical protein